jgi:hypothetical protein
MTQKAKELISTSVEAYDTCGLFLRGWAKEDVTSQTKKQKKTVIRILTAAVIVLVKLISL